MTDKEKITAILKAYTKKHNISASLVILEEYAEELIRQGVVMPIRCKDCKHCDPENRHCDHFMGTILPVSREDNDFCSYGERKDEE